VSRPVEDICTQCYIFVNRHRVLANHAPSGRLSDESEEGDTLDFDTGNEDNDEGIDHINRNIDITGLEAARTRSQEEKERMLLEAAEHIKMARTQRKLYQEKVAKAKRTATNPHDSRTYTFVIDYGQNMDLPKFGQEQPGMTYYYSPMTVNNLGMVNHAHVYERGQVSEHMDCRVYTEAEGKKGGNNVASLIMKTYRLSMFFVRIQLAVS
jgi:hypothetical protein